MPDEETDDGGDDGDGNPGKLLVVTHNNVAEMYNVDLVRIKCTHPTIRSKATIIPSL